MSTDKNHSRMFDLALNTYHYKICRNEVLEAISSLKLGDCDLAKVVVTTEGIDLLSVLI